MNHAPLRLVLLCGLIGCSSAPPDLALAEVWPVSSDVIFICFVAEQASGTAVLPWIHGTLGWHEVAPRGDVQFLTTGERREFQVKWIPANRYGVLALDNRRNWMLWWFDPERVAVRSAETGEPSGLRSFVLTKATAFEKPLMDFLRWKGLSRGLPEPCFSGFSDMDHPNIRKALRHRFKEELRLVTAAQAYVSNHETENAIVAAAKILNDADDTLSMYGGWSDAQILQWKRLYSEFIVFRSLASRGDAPGALKTLQEMEATIESLIP